MLDFVSTYEFSRIAWNGLESGMWNMEDGEMSEPVPTDEYLKVTKDDALGVETGINVYHHFCGLETEQFSQMATPLICISSQQKTMEAKMNDALRISLIIMVQSLR